MASDWDQCTIEIWPSGHSSWVGTKCWRGALLGVPLTDSKPFIVMASLLSEQLFSSTANIFSALLPNVALKLLRSQRFLSGVGRDQNSPKRWANIDLTYWVARKASHLCWMSNSLLVVPKELVDPTFPNRPNINYRLKYCLQEVSWKWLILIYFSLFL